VAGNVSASATLTFTNDNTAPGAPTLKLVSDTGASSSDNITQKASVQATSTEVGGKIEYSADNGATWLASVTPKEGQQTVLARVTDAAGNVSSSATLTFTNDNTAPTAPTIALSSDSFGTGTSGTATDLITQDAALSLSAVPTDVTRTFTINSGTPSSNYVKPTESGAYTVRVTDTDLAGNAVSSSLSFTLDSTAPPALSVKVAGDVYINATEQSAVAYTVTGQGSEPASTKVNVSFTDTAGKVVTQAATAGQGSVDLSSLKDGAITVAYTATDIAGNVSSAASATLTLDRVIAAPTVALLSDTGTVGDGITSNPALVFSIAPADLQSRTYTVNGVTSSSYTPPSLAGDYTVVVTDTDKAGNTASSVPLSFKLDTSLPPTPVLSLQNDTGASATDAITNDATVSISNPLAGATVQFSLDNGVTWVSSIAPKESTVSVIARQVSSTGISSASSAPLVFTFDKTAPAAVAISLAKDTGSSPSDGITADVSLATTGQAAGNTLSYSVDGGAWTSALSLSDGTHTVQARQVDVAGNTSVGSNTLTVTKDTTAPSGFAVTINGGDALVNRAEQPALGYTISGLEVGAVATVTFTDSNGKSLVSTTSTGKGTVDLSSLADGKVQLSVSATDLAGNTGSGTGQTVTLDGITTPTVALAQDTFGTYSSGTATDLITKNAQLSVSAAPADIKTRIYTVDGVASSSYNAPTKDGSHTVFVTDTDVAGNVATSSTLSFTLDTTVAAPVLKLAADTGSSSTDKITNYGGVSASNLEAGAYLEFSGDNGQTWVPSYYGSAGINTVIARQVDAAGNVSANSAPLTFTLDNTVNKPTLVLQASNVNDSNVHNVGFTITGLDPDAAAYVTFTDSFGHIAGSSITNGIGNADLSGLSDGTVTATVSASDAAGNYTNGVPQYLQLSAFSYQSLTAQGNTLVLNFSRPLNTAHLPTAADFDIKLNNEALTITGISASGSQLTLTLAQPLQSGSLSLNYSDHSYSSLDSNNILSTTGSYKNYFNDFQNLSIQPTVSKVVSSHSLDIDTFLSGSTADIQVYFSAPVSITGSTKPTLTLTIKPADGSAPHDVIATYAGYNGEVLSNAHDSLHFSYTTTSADVGSWSVKSVNLNGSAIVANVDGVPSSLAADLSLASATPDFSANSYFYGNNKVSIGSNGIATGTSVNDILVWSDPSTVPAAFVAASGAVISGINGGAGDRDFLSLPIFLSGVSTSAVANAYTLSFDGSTRSILVYDGNHVLQKTVAVPQGSNWPTGIEGIYYEINYKDANGLMQSANNGDTGILLSKDTLVLQDSSRPTDFFIEGSYLSDTIDVSTSLALTAGGTHAVTGADRIVIRGEQGNDIIIGHSGTDIVYGNGGTNTISTGAGDDIINLNAGSTATNTFDGGTGQDAVRLILQGNKPTATFNADGSISLGSKLVTWTTGVQTTVSSYGEQYKIAVDEASGKLQFSTKSGGTATAVGIEALTIDFTGRDTSVDLALQIGSSGHDKLVASASNSLLFGLAGNDVLLAAADGDVLNGGSGNDTLWFNARNGVQAIGGTGTDTAVVQVQTYIQTVEVVQVDATHWTINGGTGGPQQTLFKLTKLVDGSFQLDTMGYAAQGYVSGTDTVQATTVLQGVENLQITSYGNSVLANLPLSNPSWLTDLAPEITGSGNQLIVTFAQALDATNPPDARGFLVRSTYGDSLQDVSSAAISGNQLILTLKQPVTWGDVTISYADPSVLDDAKALQLQNGTDLPGFSISGSIAMDTARIKEIYSYDEYGLQVAAGGDQFGLEVYFSSGVTVKPSAGGDLPTLRLRITAPDGSSHLVEATLNTYGSTAGELTTDTLGFTLNLSDADIGTYTVDSLQLNGATITNATSDGSLGKAANISLAGATLDFSSGTYFAGSHVRKTPAAAGAGTDANDLLLYVSDDPGLPAGVLNGVFTGVNAGAGNRDLLAVQIVLPASVTSPDKAADYELRYNATSNAVEVWQLDGTAAVASYAAPTAANWPAGVELVGYEPVFRDTTGSIGFTDVAPLTFSRSTLVYQNGNASDFTVHGAIGNDVINVSSSITPTDGSAHSVADSDKIMILGNQGNDTITGHNGIDVILGGSGSNVINAGGGDDLIIISDGGSNTIDGGAGSDIIALRMLGSDVRGIGDASGTIHLASAVYTYDGHTNGTTIGQDQYTLTVDETSKLLTIVDVQHGHAVSTVTGVENIGFVMANTGGFTDEVPIVFGSAGADTLNPQESFAVVFGLGGNDTLVAGGSGGLLDGGSGDDTLRFGAGSDASLVGGQGQDTAIMTLGSDLGPLHVSHDSGTLVWSVKNLQDQTLLRLSAETTRAGFTLEEAGVAELGYGTDQHWISQNNLSSIETLRLENSVGTALLSLTLDETKQTVAVIPA